MSEKPLRMTGYGRYADASDPAPEPTPEPTRVWLLSIRWGYNNEISKQVSSQQEIDQVLNDNPQWSRWKLYELENEPRADGKTYFKTYPCKSRDLEEEQRAAKRASQRSHTHDHNSITIPLWPFFL